MRKTLLGLTAAAVITGGLAGCNNNQGAGQNTDNGGMRNVGYFNNEGHGMDNEGPLTEMLNGNNAARENNRGNSNGNRMGNNPTAINNQNGRGDQNYHGHLNGTGNNNQGRDRELKEDISERVSRIRNVRNVDTVISGDTVLIGIDVNRRDDDNTREQVRRAVAPMTRGKDVRVVTDERQLGRMRNINNDIQNGQSENHINTDVQDLLREMGNTIRRPVENVVR
ncbi:YhcN/YlaJ family sporulation lipoprotein [Metabacillus lacus]|uniref:YhcN/YlaJ family sporulation lipoprotein n=1 Tax=Metabacillus lacus TaxID=1983721 RepID=UPI0014783D59|nr:YhcN/YlaJ family sporulation lipoprotein [Metabacillus lacus]